MTDKTTEPSADLKVAAALLRRHGMPTSEEAFLDLLRIAFQHGRGAGIAEGEAVALGAIDKALASVANKSASEDRSRG